MHEKRHWRAHFPRLTTHNRKQFVIWLVVAVSCALYLLNIFLGRPVHTRENSGRFSGGGIGREKDDTASSVDTTTKEVSKINVLSKHALDPDSTRKRVMVSKDDAQNAKDIAGGEISSVTSLLHYLMPILENSKPSLGYELQSEKSIKEESSKDGKLNRFTRKYLPRVYGQNNVVNVAVHDSGSDVPILSKKYLSDVLYLPDDLYQELKISHKTFVDSIPETYSSGTYEGTGIVFIGGGKFSWLSLLSIENIRAVGSKLPIELIIPERDEYEAQLCEVFLPRLNAKCVLLYDLLPVARKIPFKLAGYQYKSIAILASSFENVLLLDSDNIAVKNPDDLFTTEPFLSNGMILWPDYWRRVTHPLYYDLAGYKISKKRVRNLFDHKTPPRFYSNEYDNPDEDVPLHDLSGTIPDLSTESGQIVVNKKTHFKALLLSFYYNVYGPRHYYPLFSQGGKGEGDKETFIAAAVYFKLPVYQMNKPVGAIGYWDGPDFKGVGMIQYNPIRDRECEQEYMELLNNKLVSLGKHYKYREMDYWNYMELCSQHPLFVHINYPKIEPISLYQENKLVDSKGRQVRLYGEDPGFGFDFETRQWRLINKYFCSKVEPLKLKYLENSPIPPELLCQNIRIRLKYLSLTSPT